MTTRKTEQQARLDKLRSIETFAECTDEELARIDSLLAETNVSAGRTLMAEGKPGLEFMVITEGTATVTRDGQTLGTVGPGDIVGEMALIDEELRARAATVTADTDMRVYVMNAGEFTSLLREVPAVRQKIMRTKAIRNHPAGRKA